jgi:hypothetical protein
MRNALDAFDMPLICTANISFFNMAQILDVILADSSLNATSSWNQAHYSSNLNTR